METARKLRRRLLGPIVVAVLFLATLLLAGALGQPGVHFHFLQPARFIGREFHKDPQPPPGGNETDVVFLIHARLETILPEVQAELQSAGWTQRIHRESNLVTLDGEKGSDRVNLFPGSAHTVGFDSVNHDWGPNSTVVTITSRSTAFENMRSALGSWVRRFSHRR